MNLSSHDLAMVFFSLGLVLFLAKALGELVKRLGGPAVMGEILAGVLLGPSCFGLFAPELQTQIFSKGTLTSVATSGFQSIAVVLFLLAAGVETRLSTMIRHGRRALMVSLAGIAVPFALGLNLVDLLRGVASEPLAGAATSGAPNVFNLFLATALAISALPVIAKTLLDLGLYRTDIGTITIAAAFIDDLLGWLIFAFVLSLIGEAQHGFSIGATLGLALGFVFFTLVVLRRFLDRLFAWARERLQWPATALWMTVVLGLFSAAVTEWIGVHALFGAFVIGVAIGDSSYIDARTKESLEQFTNSVLAPIFFAMVGLRVNFVKNFDLPLVLCLLAIASAGKILGCGIAARLTGMPMKRAWAIGFAMNARGAMVIIISIVALDRGVISEAFFVALVLLGLLTSMVSGPLMKMVMSRPSKAT